jgi:hypothetical protein
MKINIKEKRACERFAIDGLVKCSHPNSKDILNGIIINCSESGICFKSSVKLKPGTVIFLSDIEDNKYFRAEVKWCKKYADTDSDYYLIGSEYCDPSLSNDQQAT